MPDPNLATPRAERKVIKILMCLFVGLLVFHVIREIYTNYKCDRDLLSYWNLSNKASTLKQKSLYLDEFVANLEAAHLSGNNALLLKTPDNSYDQNIITLKSLQSRMEEIKGMDVRSFEYQQAMYQISAQEEGVSMEFTTWLASGIWIIILLSGAGSTVFVGCLKCFLRSYSSPQEWGLYRTNDSL